mgnify:FL=1
MGKNGPKGGDGHRNDDNGREAPGTADEVVRLAEVMLRSSEAAMAMTLDGAIVLWNHGARLTFGHEEDKVVGTLIRTLFEPGEEDKVSDALELIRWEGTAPPFEAAVRTREGGTVQASIQMSPVTDERGRTVGASLVARGLTGTGDRSKPEGTAQSERGRFLEMVDQLPYYIILMTTDRRIAFANRAFVEKFGEPGGKRCYEHLFGSSRPCENCRSFDVLKTNSPVVWEWTGPNGRIYDVYDFPFIDEDGSSMVMESGVDITEKKLADDALRKAGEYNRSLIEASLDPMLTIGPDGKITDANTATAKVTGVSLEDLIGTDFSDYFTEPDRARAGYETAFREGLVRDYELEIRSTEGHVTPVLYNASVYRDHTGMIIGVFAAARDITARRRFENELRERRQKEMERLLELEKFQRLTVGRELKMVELKKEIAELKRKIEALEGREG